MEFLVIMTVGTVIAVLIVIASRPKRRVNFGASYHEPQDSTPGATPPWKKDAALSHPIGELEYLEAIERHDNDPEHQPFPLPPPKRRDN
jgi:hypothetical protein